MRKWIKTKKQKWIVGVVLSFAGIVVLPLAVLLMWAGSNAIAASYYIFFTTQPTVQEIPGVYSASLNWGTAGLILAKDGTFEETIVISGKKVDSVRGQWQYRADDVEHAASLTLSPYIVVTSDSHSPSTSSESLFFTNVELVPYSQRLIPTQDRDSRNNGTEVHT